jgi:hypothetical protein
MNNPLLQFALNRPNVALVIERPTNAPTIGRQVRITAKERVTGGSAAVLLDEGEPDEALERGLEQLDEILRNG